ncbi:MAG: microcin ABC transporter ATP-binding protein [Rhodobacteraceae bacterium]|nr:MAG: microcin ABC transporter ATP-binding protein [Paracoccaceae bacterium]
MSNSILKIKDLSITLPKNADRKFAVEDVNLEVHKGEILCVVGESGSGKSVMTSAILNEVPGSLDITSGSIEFDNQDILKLPQKELNDLRGARISMIYQEPMAALNPSIRVGKQVDEVFALHRPEIKVNDRKAETLKLLEQMKLPTPERIYSSYAHQVSGGQCQRIVIAMALACNPDILIADEPTTALDVTTQAEILRLISDLKEIYNNTIIFITHDFGVVADIADRIVVMCQGKIIEEGQKEDILMRPKEPYTQLLVDAMPLLETTRTPDQSRTDEPSVEVSKLHKIYKTRGGQVHALNDASFVLRNGETLGVVGESGSGKSTLAKTLIRLEEPTSGSVNIRQENFLSLSGADLISSRQKIQMIFQDPFGSLNPSQTVGFMLMRSLELQGEDPVEAKARSLKLLQQVGLGDQAFNRKPRNFSGGQRQRIGIARALSMGPDVVVADECVSALDLSVQKQVLLLLNDLQSTYKMAIIFITHDLRVAAQVSDYITVMEKGKMVEFGTADDVFNRPKHDYTKRLLDAAPGKDWHPPRLDPKEAAEIAKSLEKSFS